MTYISTIKLYEQLSEKIGKETAEALIAYIEEKSMTVMKRNRQIASTSEYPRKGELTITEMKVDLIQWMFLFWVAQVVITFGVILLYLKE